MRLTRKQIRWIARLGAPLISALGSTWRIRTYGYRPNYEATDLVLAFLHGDMLVPAILYRRIPAAIMISEHGDGEIIAQVVRRLGEHVPVRGSSTRNGARAFLEMVRERGELPWAITPDGPRGPRGRVHDGVVQLAAESGRAIIAGGYAVSRGTRLRSWDRFVIPHPFARIASYLAEPLFVPAGLDRAQRDSLARDLESRLKSAEQAAARALATW